MNKSLKKYLGAPPDERRNVLKTQYLLRAPKYVSSREEADFHLSRLIEFTRRLNLIECSAPQYAIKPSKLSSSDLFVCVEISAEAIQESTILKDDKHFGKCWIAFNKLLKRVKVGGSESFFETAYLLLHLSALIFHQYAINRTVKEKPQILSLEGYGALAAGFYPKLFDDVKSPIEQLENLAKNLNDRADN